MKKKLVSTIVTLAFAAATLMGCSTASAETTETASTEISKTDLAEEKEAATSEESTVEVAAEDSAAGYTATEVHIAIQPSAAFIPLYVAREKGYIEEALAEYGVEVVWNDFESGPPMNESLASGDSDFGVIGDVPTVSAIAAGQENEVVAIAAQAADSYAVLVAADSDIETASDLKGKKIATVIGSTGHNLTQKFLNEEGLTIDDIELVNISAGDAATVLANGDVDAVAIWEPTVTRLVDNGTAKIIAEGSDVGLAGTNTIVARKAFTQDNPLIVEIVLEQYARAAAELDDLDEETLQKVAEDLSLEPEQVVAILPKYVYSVIPQQEDIDALNDTISFLVGIDAISESYDIGDYVNSSYAESDRVQAYLK